MIPLRSGTLRKALLLLAGLVPFIQARSQAASPGRFSLAAERAGYLVGEPLYLRIESPEMLPPSLEEGRYVLAIRRDQEPERVYHPPFRLRAVPSAAPEADGPHARFARLIAQDGALLFGKPGRYRLRLAGFPPAGAEGAGDVLAPGAPILSDTLSVVFTKPVTAADEKAYALIRRNPGEYALAVYLEGGDQLQEGMAILQELAAFQSAYTRMASFVLSSDWAQDFTDYRGNRSRPLDLQKALAWAQWDKVPDPYIPLRNAYRLAQGAEIQAARNPAAPGLDAVRSKLTAFLASLTPREKAWYRSFSPLSASRPSQGGAEPGR
jgi:hypothetical protein